MRRRTPVSRRPLGSRVGSPAALGVARVRFAGAVVGVLALIGIAAAPIAAAPAAAVPAAAHGAAPSALSGSVLRAPHTAVTTSGSIDVQVYASNDGVATPTSTTTFTVIVGNTTSSRVENGTVTLSITRERLDTHGDLTAWLGSEEDPPSTRALKTAVTAPVSPGGSTSAATITLPAASLGLPAGTNAVYGIAADLNVGGTSVAIGRGSLVWNAATVANKAQLAVATPITVPGNTSGLITASDLNTYTSPDGLLTRQLDAVTGAPDVAIGIDPMIIASIRALGSAAPADAASWLNDLSLLPNDIFPLQYGDADVAAQLQAGINPLLAPLSFGYALDPAEHKADTAVGEPTAPTGTPSATSTPAADVPSMASLLSWPYTLTGIAWPGDDTVRTADLAALAKAGYPTTILAGTNTNAASFAVAPSAPVTVSSAKALVADAQISTALRAAVDATTTDAHSEAMATLNAQLTLVDAQQDATRGRVILATLDRTRPTSEYLASQTYAALRSSPWVTTASLAAAIHAPSTPGLTVTDKTESDSRIDQVRSLIGSGMPAGEASITGAAAQAGGELGLTDFASLLTDPTQLTGPTRNALLALLGVGWQSPTADWSTAVQKNLANARKTIASVQIVATGPITVTAAQSQIPITVTNDFRLPVNIVLRAIPSNPRLEIDATTAKTVSAGSSGKVVVPVKARVGNGKLQLNLQLLTPPDPKTGAQFAVGDEKSSQVEVHADWEGIGATIIGIAAILLFGFGVARAILRRRRERRQAADAAGDTAADAAASTAPDAPAPDSTGAGEPGRG